MTIWTVARTILDYIDQTDAVSPAQLCMQQDDNSPFWQYPDVCLFCHGNQALNFGNVMHFLKMATQPKRYREIKGVPFTFVMMNQMILGTC